MSCGTGNSTVDGNIFDNALEDFKTIENIANSESLTTPSRLEGDKRTAQGRLQQIAGYIAINGGTWATGIDFNGYDEYMIYNGTAYKVIAGTTLPVTSTATPNLTEVEPFSITTTVEEVFEGIDEYNTTELGDFTDYTFATVADMITGTVVGGEVVFYKVNQALKVNGEENLVKCYIVNDQGDGIDLGGGLFAKEVFAKSADEGAEQSPISGLDPNNDARNFPVAAINEVAVTVSGSLLKFGAGVLSNSNKVYAPPYDGTSVLKIDPSAGSTYSEFGSVAASQQYTSLALANNGNLYGASKAGTNVIQIDTSTDTITEYNIINPANFGFDGAVTSDNGLIYFVPALSTQVAEFNPATNAINYIGSTYSGDADKWSGGCVGSNGKIYCAPSGESSILEIDPVTKLTRLIAVSPVASFGRWSGAVLAQNSLIYFMPFNEERVMILNTDDDSITYVDLTESTLASKFKGGVLGFNGKIYGMPFESNYVLEFNPLDNTIVNYTLFPIVTASKFFGGVSDVDGVIYTVPSNTDNKAMIIDGLEGSVQWQISAYSNKF